MKSALWASLSVFALALAIAGCSSTTSRPRAGRETGPAHELDVDFWNDVRPTPALTEVHRAKIIVIGNGVARLSARQVYIIVPPEGGVVLI